MIKAIEGTNRQFIVVNRLLLMDDIKTVFNGFKTLPAELCVALYSHGLRTTPFGWKHGWFGEKKSQSHQFVCPHCKKCWEKICPPLETGDPLLKMSISFSNRRIIRRFEKKNAHFEKKIPNFEKRTDFFLTIFCSVVVTDLQVNDHCIANLEPEGNFALIICPLWIWAHIFPQ